MSHVVMLLMLVFFVIPAASATTPPLTLAFDTPGINISQPERNILLQRVAAISAADIKLSEIDDAASADIVLTTRDAVTGKLYSQVSVGYVPSLVALSLQQYDMQRSLSIAQLPRAYTLAGRDVHTLPLDANVMSLLQAKRYDVIVDVSSGVFQHDVKSQLYRRSVYPGRSIRLATQTPALKQQLEQSARENKVAGVNWHDESFRAINMQLIAKSFNADKYLLQESAEDLGFISLLQQELAQFTVNSVTTSSADALASIQQALPACIVNSRKREPSTGVIYSLPTQIYLGPRLYIAKNDPLVAKLTTASELSFDSIIKQLPGVRFASLESLKKDIQTANSSAGQHHFLPLVRFDTAFSLLQRGRVDALWIYPVMFRFSLDDIAQANDFASFVLQETGPTLPVYLACNDTAETRKLMTQLDTLLLDENFHLALLRQNAAGLNDSDSREYATQYQQVLQNAATTVADKGR